METRSGTVPHISFGQSVGKVTTRCIFFSYCFFLHVSTRFLLVPWKNNAIDRGKVDSRTCQKYGSFYNLENLSFLVFSHVLGASPESSIRLPSVDSYDDAISLLKRRSCRFPYQQVAVMVPSRFPSWVDVYKSLFRQLAVKFIYVDFFVFFISKDDMQEEEKKEKNDNHRFHMILSHSCWEEEPKWNAFPVTEAVNVSAWKPSKTFLRWFVLYSQPWIFLFY